MKEKSILSPASSTRFRPGLFSICLVICSLAVAAVRAGDEALRINARSVEANEKTGTVVYSGDVVAEQGRLSIRADRIEILSRQGKTELVRATGRPVKLRQGADAETGELRAEAGRVDYHFSQRKIDLIGQVTLRRGDDVFTAGVLHYDLNTRSLNAAGDEKNNGRVHAVIQPGKPENHSPARP